MLLNWIDRAGDWNPQLFRELKGRLKPRNILLVVGLALAAQFLFVEFFRGQLPIADGYSSYCLLDGEYNCLQDALGNTRVDWHRWWLDMFRVLNWALPFLMMIPGVYMLIADLDQEERRGTLNFIRLSPQTSSSILQGKLLGVPILLYVALPLFVPLHLVIAAQASVSPLFILSFYLLLAAACYLLYSSALLCGFLGKFQAANSPVVGGTALFYVLLTLLVFFPLYMTWNLATTWYPFQSYLIQSYASGASDPSRIQWFYTALDQGAIASHVFTLANLGLMSYWVWQALQRCFHTPSATILSKQQSYGLVVYVELLLLGFCLQDWGFGYSWESYSPEFFFSLVAIVCSVTLLGFLVLIALLSNHRQTLLDWARYRHIEARRHGKQSSRRASLWWDLVQSEKSPAVVAIVLNLCIVAVLVTLWVATWAGGNKVQALVGLLMTMSLITIYAMLVQLTLLMKTSKRGLWAVGILCLVIVVPLITGAILFSSNHPTLANALLLFTPFLWVPLYSYPFQPVVYLGIMGQWLTLGMLALTLTRQLNRLGESASRPLLTGTSIAD
jgi:hypothetical protein